MALIGYFKAEPTDYILAYSNGKVSRQGAGQAFWYWEPSTSIVRIPVATIDALFVLNEITRDFQTVTVQGQVTYRITAPATLAGLLNFTINPKTRQYLSDDPTKLQQRIINLVQMYTRQNLSQLGLEEALRSADTLARIVLGAVQEEPALSELGVACLSLFFTTIRPAPEVAKALEAEQREALQRRADEAIYSRRAEAVAQERKIKQNELSTNIELEQRRQELVTLQGANIRQEAEIEAEVVRMKLAPYDNVPPQRLLALAMRDFAANADKIGNLTITSEILEQLLQRDG
jgi:regulator of protease activity HflC (stomatin/prohibitin superfamily)